MGKSPIRIPSLAGSTRRRHHEEETRVCRVGDEHLGAGEAPAPIHPSGGRPHAGEVGAAAGLGEARRGEDLAPGDGRQPLLLLGLAAVAQDRAAHEGVVDRDHGGDHPVDPGQLLADDPVGEHVHEGASVDLGDHGRDVAERHQLLDQLGGIALLPLVALDVGEDLLLGELPHRRSYQPLLRRQVEVRHAILGPAHRSLLGAGE
jgi:hypothetical protein